MKGKYKGKEEGWGVLLTTLLTLASRLSWPAVCPVAMISLLGWTAKLEREKGEG